MKGRILLIDDEPHWINFAQSDLDKFEIVVARDAEEALTQLAERSFDLVIASSRHLDILAIISEEHSSERVVVTSVQPTTQEALAAYRLGAIRYFAKSFGPQYLYDRIKEVMPNAVQSRRTSAEQTGAGK